MRPIVSAAGAWLTDAAGARVFDAIPSWWVITHGHCHPHIVQVIRHQAGRLDQVIFAGYPPEVLAQMVAICARHGALLIADGVMTGWGRAGRFLACDHAGVVPDIRCLSMGITGGHLPLAVTLCREDIYRSHFSTDRRRPLFHSSSYTANPIACAAGVANLEISEKELIQAIIDTVFSVQAEGLTRLTPHPKITGARQLGTLLAAEIGGPGSYMADSGPTLIRPLGNTVSDAMRG